MIRILQDVAKIFEFEQIWRDLVNRPTTFAPQFGGISQVAHFRKLFNGKILAVRTPRIYLQSRLTPEMETWIMFIMRNVKMGTQVGSSIFQLSNTFY